MIVDFTPHLLQYAFTLIRDSPLSSNGEIAYQLVFKVAKKLEQSISKFY